MKLINDIPLLVEWHTPPVEKLRDRHGKLRVRRESRWSASNLSAAFCGLGLLGFVVWMVFQNLGQ